MWVLRRKELKVSGRRGCAGELIYMSYYEGLKLPKGGITLFCALLLEVGLVKSELQRFCVDVLF